MTLEGGYKFFVDWTKRKVRYHVIIKLNGIENAINITQGRTISTKRLLRKKGNLKINVFKSVLECYINQFK